MSRECRRERELLQHVDGTLSAAAAWRFEEHLDACPRCQLRYHQQLELEEALLSLPAPGLTAGDWQRLVAGIDARRPATRPIRHRRILLGAAAVALAASVGGALVLRRAGPLATPSRDTAQQVEASPADPLAVAPEWAPPPELVAEAQRNRQRVAIALDAVPSGRAGGLASFRDHLVPALADSTLVEILEAFLEGPEAERACQAAGLFEAALATGELSAPLGLVPVLERALARPDRARAAWRVLRLLEGDRAWQACQKATRVAELRTEAVLHLTQLASEAHPSRLRAPLLQLVRSGSAADLGLLERALDLLPAEAPAVLDLLVTLYHEGVPRNTLGRVVDRLGPAAAQTLREAPWSRGPLAASDAVALIGLGHEPRWLPVLEELVLAGRDTLLVWTALARPRGSATLEALARLRSAALPATQQRRLQQALGELLRRDQHFDEHLVQALTRLDHLKRRELLQTVQEFPEAEAVALLTACVRSTVLDGATRSLAGLLASQQSSRPALPLFLELLAEEGNRPLAREELVSGLLVTLYQQDGIRGLRQGWQALGLELEPRQERSLARQVRTAAGQIEPGQPVPSVPGLAAFLRP